MEIELLEREHTPENVINHCKAVYKKAMKIAANFDNVDEEYLNSLMTSVMVDEEYFNSYVVVPLKVDLLEKIKMITIKH